MAVILLDKSPMYQRPVTPPSHDQLTGVTPNQHHTPSINEVWIPAEEMFLLQGSPVLTTINAGVNGYRVWNLQNAAGNQGVAAYTQKPEGWGSFQLCFVWTLSTPTATNWRRTVLHADNIQTNGLNGGSGGAGGDTSANVTAHSFNRINSFITSSYFGKAQIVREAGHANDTFTGDIYIVAFVLLKAS